MKVNKIKLVACDMDGTFLKSDRTAHSENIEAVRKLQDSGVIFCLASGRGIGTMQPMLNELGLAGPVVSSNGAVVTGINGEAVFSANVQQKTVMNIVDFAESHGIHLNHYYGSTITFSGDGDMARLYQSRTGCTPIYKSFQEIRSLPTTKLLFVAKPQDISRYADLMAGLYSAEEISIVLSEPDYIEFLAPGVNKGLGMEKLAEHIGLTSAECAGIGDWLNDIELLRWVGLPGCVANAHPEVRKICKTITKSNDDAGVSEFITSIIQLNNRGIVTP